MGKYHAAANETLTKLEEVGRRQYVMHYTDGMSIEELIRIAIERASELAVATGKPCQIMFNRDDINVIVNEECIFQPVLRRFKYALLTLQSSNEEDYISVIGPDYPDHLSRSEMAKTKEIQLSLRRQAKADAKKRRRQHHKAGRDARTAEDRSRKKPTTKAHAHKRRRKNGKYQVINDRYQDKIDAEYEAKVGKYRADFAKATASYLMAASAS